MLYTSTICPSCFAGRFPPYGSRLEHGSVFTICEPGAECDTENCVEPDDHFPNEGRRLTDAYPCEECLRLLAAGGCIPTIGDTFTITAPEKCFFCA